jgi:hypothetical protein
MVVFLFVKFFIIVVYNSIQWLPKCESLNTMIGQYIEFIKAIEPTNECVCALSHRKDCAQRVSHSLYYSFKSHKLGVGFNRD